MSASHVAGLAGGFSASKLSLMLALGTGTVLATEIGDPTLERYVSLGVGGVLAATVFYFYRQLAAQSIKNERANADTYRAQASLLIETIQENVRVSARLQETVVSLHETIENMNREQRERYESMLRDGAGRRSYDPGTPRC